MLCKGRRSCQQIVLTLESRAGGGEGGSKEQGRRGRWE